MENIALKPNAFHCGFCLFSVLYLPLLYNEEYLHENGSFEIHAILLFAPPIKS